MTFYDSDLTIPDLPRYEFALDDSPSCHQALTYWSTKASQIAPTLSTLAKSVESYYETGLNHHQSGISVSSALGDVAKEFQDDTKISEPIAKFSDVLQRIECYRDMLLNQTHLLMWEPLEALAKEYNKIKELHLQTLKAREEMHLAWEKFASFPHTINMQEPSVIDKYAHEMFDAREQYQKILLQYITSLKELHTLKKVTMLQKVLEHMLAQFSFFNFGYQTLKDVEPFMNGLFQELHDRNAQLEKSLKDEEHIQADIDKEILLQHQKDAQAFGEPQQPAAFGQSVSAMNVQAGKLFNKIGDLFQPRSASVGSKKQLKGSSDDQEWEVIDPMVPSSTDKKLERHSSLSASPNKRTQPHPNRGETLSPKKEPNVRLEEDASLLIKEESQEKVINVVPQDLLSPQSQVIPRMANESSTDEDPDTLTIVRPKQKVIHPIEWDGCKKGYLRIRQKAFPKNRWPLLYFIVDKKNGALLAQGQEQVQPSNLESLLLCTVKLCDVMDADRNCCFQLISPNSERVFQALTDIEVQEWISALQEATADALRNSKSKLQSLTRSTLDNALEAKAEPRCLVLNAGERIRKVEGNKYCADCSSPRPDWASINLGIAVCIECSGVHRSMGVHVSKVRSLSLDKWDDKTVEFMEAMGNTKVNKLFEGNMEQFVKPTRDSSKYDRQAFIKLKYMEHRFYADNEVEELDSGLAEVMASRPGDSEEELLDLSGEIQFPDQDERSLMGSSPLCLIDGCQDCSIHPCEHSGQFVSGQFAASQLVVSDSSENEDKEEPTGVEEDDESQC